MTCQTTKKGPVKTRGMGSSKGHIPTRTCISCGAKRSKRDLIRLRLDVQGLVVRDDRGKGPGRGAYVCPNKSCWDGLRKGRRLNRAFNREGPIVIHPDLRTMDNSLTANS